jgi:hypothetical protein
MLAGIKGFADGGFVGGILGPVAGSAGATQVWIPPNSVPATPIDQTPQNYSNYAGVKTSAPYMGPVGTGSMLLDPAQVAAINEAGLDEFGRVRLPSSPGWRPIGVGPNDYRAPAGTVINVYMPPGSDGEDVVAALKRYQRRNGVIPVSTL